MVVFHISVYLPGGGKAKNYIGQRSAAALRIIIQRQQKRAKTGVAKDWFAASPVVCLRTVFFIIPTKLVVLKKKSSIFLKKFLFFLRLCAGQAGK